MSNEKLSGMSLEQKRAMVRQLFQQQSQASDALEREATARAPSLPEVTFDMFATSTSAEPEEAMRFYEVVESMKRDGVYHFETPRCEAQHPVVTVRSHAGEELRQLNFSCYNYLGFSYHPEVIEAAKAALDRYGLGASGSPVLSGTLELHSALERKLVEFYGLPDRGVSLFSSGYGTNVGAVSAFIREGHNAVLDASVHMSLVEGAQLSKASVSYFRHNDPESLDKILSRLDCANTRTLVCTEGVYSADGDVGRLRAIVDVAKKHGAKVLVDEAHSVLVAGPTGRGACEAEGVLGEVDLLVVTFSKAFGGCGGALIARKEITQYVNIYAKCRMHSCAIDPAVTGGILKSLDLAMGPVGQERRQRIVANAKYLREKLSAYVDIGESSSWIIPVIYGSEKLTLPVGKFLHEHGLTGNIMQFPAVKRGEARIRIFVTSEHTREQLDRAAEVLRQAAVQLGFTR